MHAFTDKRGDSWEIELTIGAMEEIKGKLDIDLLDPLNEESMLVVELAPVDAKNIRRFCDLLATLCEEQYLKRELLLADFNRLLDPVTLKSAYDAFSKEWQDFFQSLDRMDIAEAMMKMQELIKEGVMKVTVEIKKIEFPTGNLPLNLPESSE